MTCEDVGMSVAVDLVICSTCAERPAYAKGECHTCLSYRNRTGVQRPTAVILANFNARSRGISRGQPSVAVRVLSELCTIMSHVGEMHPADPSAEVICAACGTAKAWVKGSPIPLCQMHRGWVALIGVMLDEAWDRERIMEALTA